MTASVARVQPSDRERLSRFFARVEPGFAPRADADAWLFQLSEGGEVAGYHASLPAALACGGRTYRAGWTIDLVVLPEYRARGVAWFLYRAWHPTVEVGLALGSTPESLALLKGDGWRHLGNLPYHRRLLRAEPFVGPLGRLAGPFLRPLAPREGEFAPADPAELDGLWARAAASMGAAVRRDRAYVEARYRPRPGFEYRVMGLRVSGRLEGVAVLRERLRRGRRTGLIVDLWGVPERLGLLAEHVSRAFWEAGLDVAHAYGTHAALGAALGRAGFRPRPSPAEFLVRPAPGVELPGAPGDWWIAFGDSDQERD